MMNAPALSPIERQLSQARAVIEGHLASSLQAIHLFGSAVEGGLKPRSDIDLLVTVSAPPDDTSRRELLLGLLNVSAPPGSSEVLRPLEVTVISHREVVPWRYPARRELQFGEWLRHDLQRGIFEPAVADPDLAVLLTMVRQQSIALIGPEADALFEPVPERDLFRALADTLALWNSPADWAGDERNVVLALARIWYTSSTGQVASKDVAAERLSSRVPPEHRSVLHDAQQAYLGAINDNLANRANETAAFIRYAKSAILETLKTRG